MSSTCISICSPVSKQNPRHRPTRSAKNPNIIILQKFPAGFHGSPAALTNKGKPLVQVVSPTAPKRGARDRFSRQQGRNGEYAQAHSERASIIATLRTGSREAESVAVH